MVTGMEVQVLASVMHQSNIEDIIQSMRLDSDAVIINQCEHYGYEEKLCKGHRIRLYSCAERGVGRSRNNAILRADRDICLFSDEDIVYGDGYAEKIAAEFEKNPAADMILFNIEVEEARRTYHITERKKVRWYNCGRYGAVSFAVKTESLIESGVMFSLLFGGGARYSNGEDSLFLKEFMKKGYQVYTAPVTIGREREGESTWFKSYNKKFFYDRGVLYHFLYRRLAPVMAIRFLLAHRDKLCAQTNIRQALQWMREGIQRKQEGAD